MSTKRATTTTAQEGGFLVFSQRRTHAIRVGLKVLHFAADSPVGKTQKYFIAELEKYPDLSCLVVPMDDPASPAAPYVQILLVAAELVGLSEAEAPIEECWEAFAFAEKLGIDINMDDRRVWRVSLGDAELEVHCASFEELGLPA